jgi:hypothetical protein
MRARLRHFPNAVDVLEAGFPEPTELTLEVGTFS